MFFRSLKSVCLVDSPPVTAIRRSTRSMPGSKYTDAVGDESDHGALSKYLQLYKASHVFPFGIKSIGMFVPQENQKWTLLRFELYLVR